MSAAILAGLLLAGVQPDPNAMMRDSELRAQQQMAQQREVGRDNEAAAFDAKMQTDHNIRALQAQAASPNVPAPRDRSSPNATLAPPTGGGAAAIPDDMLAESNRRVLEAARNRR